MICVVLSLAGIVLWGACEAELNRRALKAIPLRIHVNGIRGKSTVTRLIYGALRANGVRAMAKTTGTEARVLYPDGTERQVRRWGLPSIRETLWFLRKARREGATAVVIECMAVRPDLQWTVEHRMVHSTHGVITNVRHDHLESMGGTLPEIAASLGNTIPVGGVLVTGDPEFYEYYRERAKEIGTKVICAISSQVDDGAEWFHEDQAIALTLARELQLDEDLALSGMREARPDPGVVTSERLAIGGIEAMVINAMAANDPESFHILFQRYFAVKEPDAVVYNHRRDRPERLRLFLGELARLGCGEVIITGDPPPWTTTRLLSRGLSWRYVPGKALACHLERLLGERGAAEDEALENRALPVVLACGNIKGAALCGRRDAPSLREGVFSRA